MIKAEEINTFFKNRNEICINFKHCNECPISDSSEGCRMDNLTQEQVDTIMAWDPPVDWNNVPIDAKIVVWDNPTHTHRRYFAKYQDGKIYTYREGATSWSDENAPMVRWAYGRLAKDNE